MIDGKIVGIPIVVTACSFLPHCTANLVETFRGECKPSQIRHGGPTTGPIFHGEKLVSISTVPKRLHHPKFKMVVEMIAMKGWPVIISIPFKSTRFVQEYDPLPEWLDQFLGVKVIRTKDFGPSTKLLGVIDTHRIANSTIIVTMDDDRIPGPDTFESLLDEAQKYPDHIISHAGQWTTKYNCAKNTCGAIGSPLEHKRGTEYQHPGWSNRLQGCGAVLYRRWMIDESWMHIPPGCRYEDDTWFSLHARRKQIPIRVPGLPSKRTFCDEPGVASEIGITITKTNAGMHDKCPVIFKKHFKCTWPKL